MASFRRKSAQGLTSDRSGFLLDKREVERWLGQPIETFARLDQGSSEPDNSIRAHVLALDTAYEPSAGQAESLR